MPRLYHMMNSNESVQNVHSTQPPLKMEHSKKPKHNNKKEEDS